MITDRYLQVAFDVIRHDPSEEVAKAHLKAFLTDARQQGFVDALKPNEPAIVDASSAGLEA